MRELMQQRDWGDSSPSLETWALKAKRPSLKLHAQATIRPVSTEEDGDDGKMNNYLMDEEVEGTQNSK